MGVRVRMSEKEAIARGLIPDPKTRFTTSPPTDHGPVFDREQYKKEQSIPKLPSTPKPQQQDPATEPARGGDRRQSSAMPLFLAAVLGWLVGLVCGLRLGQ